MYNCGQTADVFIISYKPLSGLNFARYTGQLLYFVSSWFKRGCAYYEFTHKKENVLEDKEIIFMNKVSHTRILQ